MNAAVILIIKSWVHICKLILSFGFPDPLFCYDLLVKGILIFSVGFLTRIVSKLLKIFKCFYFSLLCPIRHNITVQCIYAKQSCRMWYVRRKHTHLGFVRALLSHFDLSLLKVNRHKSVLKTISYFNSDSYGLNLLYVYMLY